MNRSLVLLLLLIVFLTEVACQGRDPVNDSADGSPGRPPATSESRPGTVASVGHVQHGRCEQPSAVTHAAVPTTAAVQELRPLVSVRRSGVAAPIRCVVTSRAELDSIRGRFGQSLNEVPPNVDFSRNLLLIAAMGEQMNDNYWISIDTVGLSADTTYVVVRSDSPADGEIVMDMLSSPLVAVLVPRSRTIAFIERD